ncbi:EscU/YscU/HrcU family type III secretion system export apparatus switch protein [Pseudomonas fluorescens]|uniref:Surface presentation of antigens protein SpaS n=1 Tax=Pseudomonas fluorescens TaxID=294 RepID=A0A5E7GC86_PSEFL|nr:EscU/YscU/HrcU family type III secretion system export apparatus switch protein [Pseudomonas fluorescens]VVO48492.1 Surface presentation of antigens protein SpaS [Pseudomonas fluorescens]
MSSASKTEKPTDKKRRDAAKKGQTFKAKDLATTCLMLFGIIYLVDDATLMQVMEVYKRIIASDYAANMQDYGAELGWLLLRIIVPVIVVCFIASAVPTLVLTGVSLASEALKLNFNALNPINGFKKLFSLRTVKDAVKALLYLSCFVFAFWVLWRTQRQLIFSQLFAAPKDLFSIWAHLLLVLIITFIGCILLIVALDALCEYKLYIKDLMMDKESVKREHKEQDGNPEIKSRRRDLHFELLSEQVRSDIRNSRVIVANPTHIAIGIYFRPEITTMPFISLMETNQRALAVRAYAEKVGVPVITDIPLARRIFRTHQRYSFIQMEEIENVLRLLIWLEQVEQA